MISAGWLVDELQVMIAAVVIAVRVMLVAFGAISAFVNRHPTVKMLALAFLLLVGLTLLADGFHHHIPRGYVYSAMAFSIFVEMLNLRARSRRVAAEPVHLRLQYSGVADVDEQHPASGRGAPAGTTGSRH